LERPDFLFTFWFWERYAERLNEVIGDANRVAELGRQLRQRVTQWWEYEGSSLSAGQEQGSSPLEAVLFDEALSRASGSESFTPLQLFDALHIHASTIEASRSLFADGHYAQAIFEAFKRVNKEQPRGQVLFAVCPQGQR
jgi:hypothetical protein